MIEIPSNECADTQPSPCDYALLSQQVQTLIIDHAIPGPPCRGLFACVMQVDDDEHIMFSELLFCPIADAESSDDCPPCVASFLNAIPSARSYLRSYEVSKDFILAAAVCLPGGESTCQMGKYPLPSVKNSVASVASVETLETLD